MMCLLLLIFTNILQLRMDFAEDEFEMVIHFTLTVIICLAGKWT